LADRKIRKYYKCFYGQAKMLFWGINESMKPEFPALHNAIKLVRNFFDIRLMRQFADLMEGNKIINNEGLKDLNPKVEAAYTAITEADAEALRISQQANDLTQQFYYEKLKDFEAVLVFKEYSKDFLAATVAHYNLAFPTKKIDIEALVIYRMYTDGLVNSLNRICGFYSNYYKKKFDGLPMPVQSLEIPTTLSKSETLPPTERLRVSITAEHLAFLFRLLKECDVINSTKGEIHEFVVGHIQTPGMPKKRLSKQNFGKLYSSKKSELRIFWVARLAKMIDAANKK
jgi:hypothetical protein